MVYLHFETVLTSKLRAARALMREWGVDLSECLDDPDRLDTPAKLFTRKIRYRDCRPLPEDPEIVAAPADSRMLTGSLRESAALFIKDKFFDYPELLGPDEMYGVEAGAEGRA